MNLKFRIIRNVVLAVLLVAAINFFVLYSLGFPLMAIQQIKKYFFLLILLIAGFGIQIGLYTYLKYKNFVCGITTAASGGVSGISMLLCCSHYLVNFLPFISITTASFFSRYTFYILLFGIVSNAFGIIFMTSKLKNFDSDQKSDVKKISDIKKIKITGGKNG